MIQSHLAENESMVQRQLELLVGVIYWLVVLANHGTNSNSRQTCDLDWFRDISKRNESFRGIPSLNATPSEFFPEIWITSFWVGFTSIDTQLLIKVVWWPPNPSAWISSALWFIRRRRWTWVWDHLSIGSQSPKTDHSSILKFNMIYRIWCRM